MWGAPARWYWTVRWYTRPVRGSVLGLVCAAVAYWLTSFPVARGIEDWSHDALFFYRDDVFGPRPSPAKDKVIIIGLDEKSLQGTTKPLTYLSPELAAVARHALARGASAVGIDLIIPADRDSDPAVAEGGAGDGRAVGRVLEDTNRVVLPVRDIEGGKILPLLAWYSRDTKKPNTSKSVDLGFVDLNEDGDQFVRRQRLYRSDQDPLPHFALVLYAKAGQEVLDRDPADGAPRVGGRRIPVGADGRLRINFAGPPKTFREIPFEDARAAAAQDGPFPIDLADKVVIIGVTARSMGDYHSTPYANHYARYGAAPAPGRMSGPELHANVYATLYDGAYITTPWWAARGPVLAVLGALLGMAAARLSLWHGLFLAVAFHFAWKVAAVVALQRAHVRVEVTAVLLLGVLVYLATFLRRWRELRRMFGVVESEAVARALEADPDRLAAAGEERIATVLFADIRSFTTYSERHAPAEVVAMLNRYFGAVAPVIEDEGGTVVCYMGDGIMALFGAPASQPDHAARALRAAVGVARAVGAHRAGWRALDRAGAWGKAGLRIGVGVHTGPVVVGAIGSPGRLDYTAIGDVTNGAARLEGATKQYDAEVLVSADTYGRVPSGVRAALGVAGSPVAVEVKGKAQPLTAYPLAIADDGAYPTGGGRWGRFWQRFWRRPGW